MKLWSAVFIAAFIFGAVAVLDGQAPAPTAPSPPPASVAAYPGRYQLIAVAMQNASNEIWMIDSQTGDTWRRQGNRWIYAGNPTQDPGTKLPARAASRPAAPPVLPETP